MERVLLEKEGKTGLEDWFAFLMGRRDIIRVIKRFSLKIKGFRIDKAPFKVLISALVKGFNDDPKVRRYLLELLAPGEGESLVMPSAGALGEEEVDSLREENDKLKEDLNNAQRRIDSLEAKIEKLEKRIEKAKAQEEKAKKAVSKAESKIRMLEEKVTKLKARALEAKGTKKQLKNIQELEEENERLRANVALLSGKVAALEQELEEARKSGRGKKKKKDEGKEEKGKEMTSIPETDLVLIPVFEKGFHESLLSYSEQDVARILRTIFLACQQQSYPSLNFKKLSGKGKIWSLRAAPSIRVFFKWEGKTLRFLDVADREDQDAVLKKLRERYL